MTEQTTRLQDVFSYLLDVTRQCQRLVQDSVEALSRETGCYFEHMKTWDNVVRPTDHFLDRSFSAVPRVWLTYVPRGNLKLAVLFYFQFFHTNYQVTPALMYGTLDPGPDQDFDDIDRWASWAAIVRTEQGKEGISAELDDPFRVVNCTWKKFFLRARLVRVPLESITSWEDLQRIVVKPLTALVRGEAEEARELLNGVETIPWPAYLDKTEDQEDETEETESV